MTVLWRIKTSWPRDNKSEHRDTKKNARVPRVISCTLGGSVALGLIHKSIRFFVRIQYSHSGLESRKDCNAEFWHCIAPTFLSRITPNFRLCESVSVYFYTHCTASFSLSMSSFSLIQTNWVNKWAVFCKSIADVPIWIRTESEGWIETNTPITVATSNSCRLGLVRCGSEKKSWPCHHPERD